MTDQLHLPREVVRPLRLTAVAMVAFLMMFCGWAVFAPLSTTLHLSGKITSSRPTFELQHPYGGLIGEVLVTRHESLDQGQIIMRFDMALEKEQLDNLLQTQAIYESENRLIDQILESTSDIEIASAEASTSPYVQRAKQASVQSALQNKNAEFLREQAEALRTKISLSEQQLNLMRGRQTRQTNLEEKGLIRLSESEVLKEQILIVQSEIERDRASLSALLGQIEAAQSQAQLVMLSLSEQLTSTRDANTKRLQEIARQIAGLREQIEKSTIRSPVHGVVSDIHFEATGMYASRGATLVSITQALAHPMITFEVPASQIDQLGLGMTGKLILTSLPQREMPRIDLVIMSISPRATLDENGNPVSYTGTAEIQNDSLQYITDIHGIRLTEDMPARLSIEARKTTLANYILEPLLAISQQALQD